MPLIAALPSTISSATPGRRRRRAHDDDGDVLEQHAERQQHDAERGQRVEARERRGEEGAGAPGDDEQPEDDVAQAVIEEEAQARPGEALEPADHPHQAGEEALLAGAGQLEPAPALRQPDLRAARDQLQREQHGDDLEHVRGAAGRQRQRRHAEQEHEQDREALLLEQLDEAPEGLLAVALQPAFELVADAVRLLHPRRDDSAFQARRPRATEPSVSVVCFRRLSILREDGS